MRTVFYAIGGLAITLAAGLIAATMLAKVPPLSGYSASAFLFLAAAAHIVAGKRNYRGHWAFVTGIALLTLAFASIGGDLDAYASSRDPMDLVVGGVLALAFFAFGALTLWSSYALHICFIQVEQNRSDPEYGDYSI
jgi:hypothetical protein